MGAANPMRGEALLKVGDRELKIVLDANAFCIFEETFGEDTDAMLERVKRDRWGMRMLRSLLHAGLSHLDEPPHLFRCGEIIGEVRAVAVKAALFSALLGAFGTAKADDQGGEGKESPDPQSPAVDAGTG
jgi:hypothetical protein